MLAVLSKKSEGLWPVNLSNANQKGIRIRRKIKHESMG